MTVARLIDILAAAWFAIAIVAAINTLFSALDVPLSAFHAIGFALACAALGGLCSALARSLERGR